MNSIFRNVLFLQKKVYDGLLHDLTLFVDTHNLGDLVNFEIGLATVKLNRDRFPKDQLDYLSQFAMKKGYPKVVATGGYLDFLEKPLADINMAIKERKGIVEADWRLYDPFVQDERERDFYFEVADRCLNGLLAFRRDMDERIAFKKTRDQMDMVAGEFLESIDSAYQAVMERGREFMVND